MLFCFNALQCWSKATALFFVGIGLGLCIVNYIVSVINYTSVCVKFIGLTAGNIIISLPPKSQNVTEGSMVSFVCVTPDSGVTLSWHTLPIVTNPTYTTIVDDRGKLSSLNFTATVQHNNTIVTCVANKHTSVNKTKAVLLVQGKLKPESINSYLLNYLLKVGYVE